MLQVYQQLPAYKCEWKNPLSFFDTPEEIGRQYAIIHENTDDEPCNGFALSALNSKDGVDHIFAVYNNKVKCVGFHEDAHIISYSLGRPVSQFVREGLAMFFDRYWWGIDNYSWTRWYVEQRKNPSVTELLENAKFNEYSDTLTYPIAGAFTGYLIERFGTEKCIDFYRCSALERVQAFEQIFCARLLFWKRTSSPISKCLFCMLRFASC